MYDYIRDHYDFDPVVGARVHHTTVHRDGTIRREARGQGHYVQVQFDGDRYALPCHPGELELIEAESAAAAPPVPADMMVRHHG